MRQTQKPDIAGEDEKAPVAGVPLPGIVQTAVEPEPPRTVGTKLNV